MIVAAGIGGQIVQWFDVAVAELPDLLAPSHPAGGRIDRVIGILVDIGVAEA